MLNYASSSYINIIIGQLLPSDEVITADEY
ncbi:hypothetical protein DFR78_12135 [Halanaerobium sp. MA284_MarDTE_T2]|nr:hypothetical protein DFR78_12135 [Halanaerobium sp. MA284_MarDTE_T2]RCW86992.1 hypothetical protein DER71_106100 [Halanaerobium sp. DL-01]